MSVPVSVHEFLRVANVSYALFSHRAAYDARHEAAMAHVPRRDWAKSVVCFADGKPIVAVVSANQTVDLGRLRQLAGAATLRLACEEELDWLYPDCERGAMPPFGPLYRQPVYVDEALAAEERIVFNAGTHVDAVAMSFLAFATLVEPTIGEIART